MQMDDILLFVSMNGKILVIFLLLYSLSGIIIYILYNLCIKKLSFWNSVKNCYRVLKILYVFNYPILKFYNISAIKKLVAKAFIPITQMNLFWTDKKEIQLEDSQYEFKGKKSGIIKLTKLILKKEGIEIIYDIESKDDIKLISKSGRGKDSEKNITNRNLFILNNKEYICYVDSEKITVPKCSGYYIFNDSQLEFKSKVKNGEFFSIRVNQRQLFNYEEQYSVKELIDICGVLCQLSVLVSCLVMLFVSIYIDIKIVVSIICIDTIMFKSASSIIRRLFDIFRESKFNT